MKRVVFLDRDGVINKDVGYLYRKEYCEYVDGAILGMSSLAEMGFALVIITNQSGIARGYFTENDYLAFMDWMISDLEKKGVKIAGHYWCPHLPGALVKKYSIECNCRKPKTGLFYKAVDELKIGLVGSFAVGDRLRDLSICKDTGVRGILLGDADNKEKEDFSYYRCKSWDEIVDYVRKHINEV